MTKISIVTRWIRVICKWATFTVDCIDELVQ